jgi:hypothetical protein
MPSNPEPKALAYSFTKRSEFARKEVYPVRNPLLEDPMSDTAAQSDCCVNQELLSDESLVQLKDLADRQGWSLEGTVRRAVAILKADSTMMSRRSTSVVTASALAYRCAN